MFSVRHLSRLHSDYANKSDALKRALYLGGDVIQNFVKELLPQHPAEANDSYETRCAMALYPNDIVPPVVNSFLSQLFLQPPTIMGVESEFWKMFSESCDGMGMSFSNFAKRIFSDMLVVGECYVWVDFPMVDEPVNLHQQMISGGLDAFLKYVSKESVINWKMSSGFLDWAVVKNEYMMQESPLADVENVVEWYVFDKQSIRKFEWRSKDRRAPSSEEFVPLAYEVQHGLGVVPLFRCASREGFDVVGRIKELVIQYYRVDAGLNWAMHKNLHPLLVLTTMGLAEEPVVLGHGYSLNLHIDKNSGIAEKAEYLEAKAISFDKALAFKDLKRREILASVQQMANNAREPNRFQSGEARRMDYVGTKIVLGEYSQMLKDVLAFLCRFIAKVRGDKDSDLYIAGMDYFMDLDIETLVQGVLLSAPKIPSETWHREVGKKLATHTLPELPKNLMSQIYKELDDHKFDMSVYYAPELLTPPESEEDLQKLEKDRREKAQQLPQDIALLNFDG